MTREQAIEKLNAKQNAENIFTNITEADIEAEMEKEEATMKTTTFELNGTTYTKHLDTSRYSKTVNGKTTRIGKAEYEAAQNEHHMTEETDRISAQEEQEAADQIEADEEAKALWAAQEELDKDPCFVDPMADLQKPAVLNEYGCVDCSECHVKPCVHRDCMRRNPRSEGGLAECPRLKVKAEEDETKNPEIERIKEEIPGIEDAEAELEKNIRKEKKAKKAAKPRKSKDIAYEGNGVTLTAKQVDFIHHLPDTCFWEMGIHSVIWVDCLCDDIGGQFTEKPMTVGAMISTLCEKKLGFRTRDTSRKGKPIAFSLTELGRKVAEELGLD